VRAGTDYYTLLQVDPQASEEVIRKAYRVLAAKCHPDGEPRPGMAPDPDPGRRMRELNLAYETLSDPVRRGEYDRSRARRLLRLFYDDGLVGLAKRWMRREGLS
jgi:DnaJ-class molecular chaperone